MAMPSAAEMDVLECPTPKWSYGLSLMRGNPLTPSRLRRVWKRGSRPVSSLWA